MTIRRRKLRRMTTRMTFPIPLHFLTDTNNSTLPLSSPSLYLVMRIPLIEVKSVFQRKVVVRSQENEWTKV
jgi:hypothetical protein